MVVAVVPHDPRWAEMFAVEAGRVAAALGVDVAAVHHIGSTAIPGIYAKPILDLLVEAADLDEVDRRAGAMEALGYETMGEFGIAGRRYFRKDDAAGVRTHHVHLFLSGSPQVERHLAFRDFLRRRDDWAQKYSELKRRLAAEHRDDAERYMDGKHELIQEIDRQAARWRTRFLAGCGSPIFRGCEARSGNRASPVARLPTRRVSR
ncbi:MAG: GrpB family protein [Pirellulales bacterium]